jgi:hypothetical protein
MKNVGQSATYILTLWSAIGMKFERIPNLERIPISEFPSCGLSRELQPDLGIHTPVLFEAR